MEWTDVAVGVVEMIIGDGNGFEGLLGLENLLALMIGGFVVYVTGRFIPRLVKRLT